MASTNTVNVKQQREENVDIRDLQPLLRKCLSNTELKVIKYKITKLLPLGENYGSILLKIEASICRDRSTEEETMHLVAKTINITERPIINWYELLPKEVFIYSELVPTYQRIEREFGIKETDVINILPPYVGHRYSLDEISKVVDDYSLLLMENMKFKGYYNCDKRVGESS